MPTDRGYLTATGRILRIPVSAVVLGYQERFDLRMAFDFAGEGMGARDRVH